MNDNHNKPSFKPPQGDMATFRTEQPQLRAGVPPSLPGSAAQMRSQPWQPSPPAGQVALKQSTPAQQTHVQNMPGAPSASVLGSQPSKKKRNLLIGSLLVLLILLGGDIVALWWFTRSPNVTLYQVAGQNANQDVGGGGIVYPLQQLDISYPTSELVKAVFVKAGDQVTPKQSLIQLDASQLNIQIQQAASDMAAAQATLNSTSASGNALQIAQAQQAFQLAKDRYNALVAQAQSPTLSQGNLISPMRGVVTAVNINPGEVIAANVPMITIMDESTVVVHAKIPLANLGQVHLGQPATVTPSAMPNFSIRGSVSSIIPQADPQTDTFEVWVNVTNSQRVLLPGMSAFVHLQSAGKAFVVPRLAVLDAEGQAAVFVVQGLYAHLQRVQVVGRTVDTIFIANGIKAGDKVVLVGNDGLQDNQRVSVSRIEQNTSTS